MEGVVDNPPVRGPFLALVCRQAVGQQPLDPKNRLLLPKHAGVLVSQDLPHEFGVVHDHSRLRPVPGHGEITVLPGDAVVEGKRSRSDGVRRRREGHGLGVRRGGEAEELRHVAGGEAVRRAR